MTARICLSSIATFLLIALVRAYKVVLSPMPLVDSSLPSFRRARLRSGAPEREVENELPVVR